MGTASCANCQTVFLLDYFLQFLKKSLQIRFCKKMATRQVHSSKRNHSKEIQDILNDKDCEELDPDSGSIHTGNPIMFPEQTGTGSKKSQPPTSLNLPVIEGAKYSKETKESPIGFHGVDVEGVTIGDSPNAETMMRGMPDYSASTGSLGSGTRPAAKQMTVTSPPAGWSGTSWTGGLTQGCAPTFKTSASVNDLPSSASSDSIALRRDANKLETIKNWTISTYKCSSQALFEKLGKTSRTVDTELESQIENLRDTQRKYGNVLRLARALTSHFYHVIQTQSALGECFGELAHKSPELQEEFLYNAETQRSLSKNGESLLAALNFFVSSINTIVNKTMEDSIVTVRLYEVARVEFDAHRSDLEYYS